MSQQLSPTINHVELVYRPGERTLAHRVLELFGCEVEDPGGPFLRASVDPVNVNFANNTLYASEVTPEQWRLEQALDASARAGGELPAAVAAYLDRLRGEPQRSFHFGIRFGTEDELMTAVERIRKAGEEGELAGRVGVSGVFRPGDPGAYSKIMVQAFTRTDVVAAGLLHLGQHVELQWHLQQAAA